MGRKVLEIEFDHDGFQSILTSNEMFALVRGQCEDIASRVRAKTRVNTFRGTKGKKADRRPLGAVWTDAKDEKEAYEARNQLRGAV